MRLSVCIPTYNRAHTLGTLLEVLKHEIDANGLGEFIDIVIADNASTDGTTSLVDTFRQRGMQVSYYVQERNMGFGHNLNTVISRARGDYCWLMGSDDLPVAGALAALLKCIDGGADLIVGEVLTNGHRRALFPGAEGQLSIRDQAEAAKFISACQEISALFAFMSSLVVRRAYWDAIVTSPYVSAHPYTHQIRLFTGMVDSGVLVHNYKNPIVSTGDEGNEWDAEIGKHFELDCRTLVYISEEVFLDNVAVFSAFGEVFRRQYGLSKMLRSRSSISTATWNELTPILSQWGYGAIWLKKRFYDKAILVVYRQVKKMKRAWRK